MPSTLELRVQRAPSYIRLNFLFRLVFGLYFILYIGHLMLLAGYQAAAYIIASINWVLALITGHNQRGLTDFVRKFLRFDAKMKMSLMGLVEPIPHVDINRHDPEFPVHLEVQAQPETTLLMCFLRLSWLIHVLLVPHWICILFLRVAVAIVYLIGFFAVLFTGRWPAGLFQFIVGVYRWQYRIMEYWYGLTDDYPPFSLN